MGDAMTPLTYTVQMRDPGTGLVLEWRNVSETMLHWIKHGKLRASEAWKLCGPPEVIFWAQEALGGDELPEETGGLGR